MQGRLLDHGVPVIAHAQTAHGLGPTNRSGGSCSRMQGHQPAAIPGAGRDRFACPGCAA